MAGIRLEWAQFGDFESFDVIRSNTSMASIADVDLPSPIATGLATMYYVDTTVVVGAVYYYKIRTNRSSGSLVSDEFVAVAATTFDSFLISLEPLCTWKLDEASGSVANGGGLDATNGVFGSNVTYRGMVLRKGHAGAAGFAVPAEAVSKVTVSAPASLRNLTLGSFTWFVWVHPTANTSYNWIFANWIAAGSGTANMRANRSGFEFPHNTRGIGYGLGLNTTYFIAVVYNINAGTYKAYINGTWVNGTYSSPPTSVDNSSSFEFPAAGGWDYYGMRGYLSDLTFFDKALSDTEVEGLYTLGSL